MSIRSNRARISLWSAVLAGAAIAILDASIVRGQDIERLRAGIVKITTHVEEKRRVGTGFIVRLEPGAAYVLTASHVIEGDPEPPQVSFCIEPTHSFAAKVLGIEGGDPTGLAALVIEGDLPSGLRALPVDDTSTVKTGDHVSAIGFPLHLGSQWTVVEGQISGFKGRALTLQAPIEEGNSGGPLLSNGKVIGVITEKRGEFASATNALVVLGTLKGWGVEAKAEIDSPVGITGTLSDPNWMISISIAEKATEIFYKVGDAPVFKSTGSSGFPDQQTGLPMPQYYFNINNEEVQGAITIQIKYRDQRGRERGPYSFAFDPKAERLRETKQILETLTGDRWLEYQFSNGELIVYFSHLVSYRDGLRDIRYSVDNETVSEHFPFKPWKGAGPAEIDSGTQISVDVPLETNYVAVKLTYLDGTESDVKVFRKPSGMATEEGVEELKQELAANPGMVKAKDDNGQTALHRAAEEGQIGVVNVLLAAGAAVDARDQQRRTPLHRAAEQGRTAQTAVAKILLAHKADANARDSADKTPLHHAARSGSRAFVEVLIANGADVNAVAGEGDTPLHEADKGDVAEALLAHQAQIEARNSSGETPLYVAADFARKDVVKVLAAHHANFNAKNNSDLTPLYAAVDEGRDDIARLLLDNGADPNAADDDGETPLHVAAEQGDAEVVEMLIAAKANVNARDSDERTPLHVGAKAGYRDVVDTLLANKADPTAKDRDGKTPLDFAVAEEAKEIVDVLRGHLANTSK